VRGAVSPAGHREGEDCRHGESVLPPGDEQHRQHDEHQSEPILLGELQHRSAHEGAQQRTRGRSDEPPRIWLDQPVKQQHCERPDEALHHGRGGPEPNGPSPT
jgi:hypothetical protein